uniref:ubiquitinyl hydrolase 1 n=1 Tax=Panagrolaimus superbus TaxID=310955 RepID=A0A914Y0N9_9BILA
MGENGSEMEKKEPEFIFYHEQQELQMCLKHALNNLLQRPAYTKELLNDYCLHLDDRNWFNPHRSMLGLGNYDVNVLMLALSSVEEDLTLVWFDSRLKYKNVNNEKVFGYIFNKPNTGLLSLITRGRHWFTVLPIDDGRHYNLDSKLARPERIMDFPEFFNDHLAKGGEILIATKFEHDGVIKKPTEGI